MDENWDEPKKRDTSELRPGRVRYLEKQAKAKASASAAWSGWDSSWSGGGRWDASWRQGSSSWGSGGYGGKGGGASWRSGRGSGNAGGKSGKGDKIDPRKWGSRDEILHHILTEWCSRRGLTDISYPQVSVDARWFSVHCIRRIQLKKCFMIFVCSLK